MLMKRKMVTEKQANATHALACKLLGSRRTVPRVHLQDSWWRDRARTAGPPTLHIALATVESFGLKLSGDWNVPVIHAIYCRAKTTNPLAGIVTDAEFGSPWSGGPSA
jgi:hypothetical protein